MRKKSLVLPLLFGLVSFAWAHDPLPIVSPYTNAPPAIDGDIADWDRSTFIEVTPENGVFDGESGTTDDAADLSFAFGVANDGQYLYVAVVITDDLLVLDTNPDPTEKDARAWMDDAVEIFLDGDHSHSPDARDAAGVEFETGGEFSIVANGAVTSKMSGVPLQNGDPDVWISQGSYGPEGDAYQSPWDSGPGEFVVEARFHYQIMGESVGPGSTVGFTVSAHDDDDGGGRDTALYWKGVGRSSWRDEGGWGDLVLSAAPTAVEPASLGQVKASLKDAAAE